MAASEFATRRQALERQMAAGKLDALVVSFGPNVRYLTGFTGSNGVVVILPGRAVFFTDPRYRIQAAQEVGCQVRVASGPILPRVASLLRQAKSRRVGFEKSRMSVEAFQTLKDALPMRSSLEPVAGWIENHRMIKSAAEIAAIRRSVELNSRAFEQIAKRIRPGMRETELAAELDYRVRRQGAEGPAFETIVAAGPRTALPHARPTTAKLPANSMVLVDMGAMLDGYASDMTRMLFLGTAAPRIKQMYAAVLEAQLAAIDAVRPGVKAQAVDRAARRVLARHHLERAFVHSTGHGLGLEIHEPPRVGKKEKTVLVKGMAITIEPGVYLEGLGGIRIEDTVVVTANGCEVLTPTSKDLRTVFP
ncbi:MAG TPA: Xaa-Pro peptidase family protein [Bryobacteraceae bacterium]|nr:Xaa-Pro peptidase family protein [Bryobacteraceae bacterium]